MSSPQPARSAACHATCVVVGEAGVLICGASGSGKSTLAREIVAAAQARGAFARLVADDRVQLDVGGGRIVARPHPAIAGRQEVRGLGIVGAPHAAAAVVRLVVDCGEPRLDRLPESAQLWTRLNGLSVRRIVAGPGEAERVLLALQEFAQ